MNPDSINITGNSLYPQDPFDPEEENSWQVSYLDIITIVLGFLIILLSVSQIAKEEFSSLSTLFGELADQTEFITTPIEDIQEELEDLLQPQIELGRLELLRDLNDLVIRFRGDDFYQSGNATIQLDGMDLLNHVIRAFQQTSHDDFNIDVEGHTDNVPISSDIYPSNWELSTARASNVVKYFDYMGIETARLKASGYADSRPLIQFDSFGNPFLASNERNRRIVLRLYYTTEALERKANQEQLASTEEVETPETREPENQEEEQSVTEIIQTLTVNETPVTESEQETQNPITSPPAEQNEPEEREATPPSTTTNPTPVQAPNPEPVTETEDDAPVSLASIPIFTDRTVSCSFSVNAGSFQSLSSGFQVASNAESRTNYEFEVSYNSRSYSVRSNAFTSFDQAMVAQQEISEALNDESLGIIHQCYPAGVTTPTPLQYQIQFGAFQNQENALDYSVNVLDEFGIQTFMTRRASTYNVVAGPFLTRENVLTQLGSFREKGVRENIFIKPITENVEEYGFAYQIHLESFETRDAANNLATRLQSALNIGTTIERSTDGTYYVMTERFENFGQASALFNRIQNRIPAMNPVIFFLEYL